VAVDYYIVVEYSVNDDTAADVAVDAICHHAWEA